MGLATESNAREFEFKGDKYDTVISTPTGRIWLDRNLRADQVATSSDDSASYGDLYQWGRPADGHQLRTSGTTTTQATRIDPGNSDFIAGNTNTDWTSADMDDDGALRSAFWAKTDGTGICPIGFRVPTGDEWQARLMGL